MFFVDTRVINLLSLTFLRLKLTNEYLTSIEMIQSRIVTFNGYVLNSKTKNDRPDHAQGHFQISIDDF